MVTVDFQQVVPFTAFRAEAQTDSLLDYRRAICARKRSSRICWLGATGIGFVHDAIESAVLVVAAQRTDRGYTAHAQLLPYTSKHTPFPVGTAIDGQLKSRQCDRTAGACRPASATAPGCQLGHGVARVPNVLGQGDKFFIFLT